MATTKPIMIPSSLSNPTEPKKIQPNEIKYNRLRKQYKNPLSKWHPDNGYIGDRKLDAIKTCIHYYPSYELFEKNCPGVLDKLSDEIIGGKRKTKKTKKTRKSRKTRKSKKR